MNTVTGMPSTPPNIDLSIILGAPSVVPACHRCLQVAAVFPTHHATRKQSLTSKSEASTAGTDALRALARALAQRAAREHWNQRVSATPDELAVPLDDDGSS